jgi:hypothetical protein
MSNVTRQATSEYVPPRTFGDLLKHVVAVAK